MEIRFRSRFCILIVLACLIFCGLTLVGAQNRRPKNVQVAVRAKWSGTPLLLEAGFVPILFSIYFNLVLVDLWFSSCGIHLSFRILCNLLLYFCIIVIIPSDFGRDYFFVYFFFMVVFLCLLYVSISISFFKLFVSSFLNFFFLTVNYFLKIRKISYGSSLTSGYILQKLAMILIQLKTALEKFWNMAALFWVKLWHRYLNSP